MGFLISSRYNDGDCGSFGRGNFPGFAQKSATDVQREEQIDGDE